MILEVENVRKPVNTGSRFSSGEWGVWGGTQNNEFSFPEHLTPLSVSSSGQTHCPGPAEYCRVILLDHMERIVIHKTE